MSQVHLKEGKQCFEACCYARGCSTSLLRKWSCQKETLQVEGSLDAAAWIPHGDEKAELISLQRLWVLERSRCVQWVCQAQT